MQMRLLLIILFSCNVAFSQEELKVKFSIIGGFYDGTQQVELSAPAGSAVYYTLDGSTPNSSSIRYNKPITTEEATIVRAVAYNEGKRSTVNTQSFFSGREFSLPVISVVSDPANFWDFATGIYVKGCCADSIPPYYGANFWKSWERPCNIELYSTEGKQCINQQAGVRIFGGYSKMLPQKSLTFVARKKYGKNRFDYPIFKERKTKEYKTFILRNSGGDFRSTQLRDAFMTQLAKPSGIAIQAYEPAIVFINGKYWGIQNLREKLNEHYLVNNFNVDKDQVDLLKHNAGRQHGFSTDYRKLLAFLRKYDLSDDYWADSLNTFMDIHDFITYNICETYSQNQDAGGNIRYFKERKPGARWRWILFDLDLGLGSTGKSAYKENTLHKFTTLSNEIWPNPGWSTFIIRSLLSNKKLEAQYINTFSDYLNTIFQKDTASALLDQMAKRIEHEIPFHQKRWGSSVENWEYNIDRVRTFVKERPAYIKTHLMEKFGLDEPVRINVILPEDGSCKVKLNSLTLKRNFSGEYFKSVPVNVKVITAHDYEFVGWKNRKENSSILSIKPSEGLVLEPIIKPRPLSTYKDSVFVNEISFIQVEDDTTGDWIELYNASGKRIDLSGWSVTKSKFSKGFFIKEGVIEPNDYFLVSRKQDNFQATHQVSTSKLFGDFGFGLSKSGESLKLYDAQELIVESLVYPGDYADFVDSVFTFALIHPDSLRTESKNWLLQKPTPADMNGSYIQILNDVEKARQFRNQMYMVFAGALLIVVLVFFWIRTRKRKATQLSPNIEASQTKVSEV